MVDAALLLLLEAVTTDLVFNVSGEIRSAIERQGERFGTASKCRMHLS
jgi:hypothetical protein